MTTTSEGGTGAGSHQRVASDLELGLCCSCSWWNNLILEATCCKGFLEPARGESRSSSAAWRALNGLDYSLYKNKEKETKQLILLSRQEKQTLFLSDCKSVYKCTACGCVRGCVIGKVYQHLNYCKEIFQIRALTKAHTLDGFLFPLRSSPSRTWDSASPLDTLTPFCERPFDVKSH